MQNGLVAICLDRGYNPNRYFVQESFLLSGKTLPVSTFEGCLLAKRNLKQLMKKEIDHGHKIHAARCVLEVASNGFAMIVGNKKEDLEVLVRTAMERLQQKRQVNKVYHDHVQALHVVKWLPRLGRLDGVNQRLPYMEPLHVATKLNELHNEQYFIVGEYVDDRDRNRMKLNLPGGKRELGEICSANVEREVEEETSIDIVKEIALKHLHASGIVEKDGMKFRQYELFVDWQNRMDLFIKSTTVQAV